ncbi:MAG: PAS domain-containing sensor histidine kinase [Anaerolineae bacterium]|nr:PAS domain-containing sensor histidine kinase [Anaerolineae bacterium]
MISDPNCNFQLNFLWQTAAEGILLADSEGRVTRLNPAAAAMLHMAPDDVLGLLAKMAFKKRSALVHLLTETGEHQAEVRLPHRRLAYGVGMDCPDGSRIVLLNDVTEQADIESRRETLMRAISHDLRNPLNALRGYADLVGKLGNLEPDQQRFLDRICQTVDKLYDLTQTLVDLAWIEAGMALEHHPFELAHLIHEAAEDLADEAHKHGVTIVKSTQEPIPTVIGDPRRIKQAITCLLQNGVRYSYPDTNVAIHAWQDGSLVFCSVGDQGFGISEADQDHVWDRLWRSDDERVRAIPGGGIGLTFARAIIERHGGQVWIESAPEKGTTATFVLPLAEGW